MIMDADKIKKYNVIHSCNGYVKLKTGNNTNIDFVDIKNNSGGFSDIYISSPNIFSPTTTTTETQYGMTVTFDTETQTYTVSGTCNSNSFAVELGTIHRFYRYYPMVVTIHDIVGNIDDAYITNSVSNTTAYIDFTKPTLFSSELYTGGDMTGTTLYIRVRSLKEYNFSFKIQAELGTKPSTEFYKYYASIKYSAVTAWFGFTDVPVPKNKTIILQTGVGNPYSLTTVPEFDIYYNPDGKYNPITTRSLCSHSIFTTVSGQTMYYKMPNVLYRYGGYKSFNSPTSSSNRAARQVTLPLPNKDYWGKPVKIRFSDPVSITDTILFYTHYICDLKVGICPIDVKYRYNTTNNYNNYMISDITDTEVTLKIYKSSWPAATFYIGYDFIFEEDENDAD